MKNTDITEIIRRSLSKKSIWNEELFLHVLNGLASALPGAKVDWDSGVPENWGRVLLEKTFALVCFTCPLVVFIGDVINPEILKTKDLECIYAASMRESRYCVEISALEELAGRKVSKNIDWDNCSIQEIWWATVI